MPIAHERKDKGAVPEARRKSSKTKTFEGTWGGKAFAVEEGLIQLELFGKTAEMRREKASAKGNRGGSDQASKPEELKFANKANRNGSTEMEAVCARIDDALKAVVSNKGAPGLDRQTVEEVKANWEAIRPKLIQALQEGKYQPGDIRRVWIPKAGGGERGLGIPNVIDRVVQEAVRQEIESRFELGFHENSHGFRPKRSCHTAIKQAEEYLKEGCEWVVDLDLKDFFNRVNHQRLLASLERKLKDKKLLRLISRMLKAKVILPDGVCVRNEEGVPQGGPLSPLLSNIVLDELDKELERRKLRFVRYADDCNIYVKSKRAGERVMASITQFIEKRLRLEVNAKKSAVAKPFERHFLGFSLKGKEEGEIEINLSERTMERLKERVKELTPRNCGTSVQTVIEKVNEYLKGWIGFFGICTASVERILKRTDAHIRRRLRALTLKHWKSKLSILRKLVKLGANKEKAGKVIYEGRKGLWKLSHTPVVDRALNNAYWSKLGLRTLESLWQTSSARMTLSVPKQILFCFS